MALPAVTLSLPAAELGISLEAMAWPVTLFTLAMGLTSLPAGLLADRWGAARVLTLFFWLTAVGAALCWASQGYAAFLLAHTLLGAAAGLYHPSGLGLLSLSVERRSLGMAMGLHGMAGPTGMAVAPLAMFGLAELYGWRAGFGGLALVCAAMAVVAHVVRRGGWVLDEVAAVEEPQDGEGLGDARVWLLVAVVGVNAFLADGLAPLLPETIKAHGVFVWDLETVVFAVLAMGAVGQFFGGLLARGKKDVRLYALVVALQGPLLLATAAWLDAELAPFVLLAAFVFFNFMTQPIENSLLASFTRRQRRGTVYALKFLVGLVVGSPAAVVVMSLAGQHGFARAWSVLGVVGALSIVLVLFFARRMRRAPAPVPAP